MNFLLTKIQTVKIMFVEKRVSFEKLNVEKFRKTGPKRVATK